MSKQTRPRSTSGWMMKLARTLVCGLLLCLVLLPGGQSQAGHTAPVSSQVQDELSANGAADILVVFSDQPGRDLLQRRFSSRAEQGQAVYQELAVRANSAQQALQSLLSQQGVNYQSFSVVNSIALRASSGLIAQIASRPEVAYIVSNAPFHVDLEQPQGSPAQVSSANGVLWNLTWVHAPDVWAQGFDGAGIVYANADTGVQWDHPSLKGQYRGWNGTTAEHNYNWWDGVRTPIISSGNICSPTPADYPLVAPCDDNGHGTHTMGTGVGNAASGNSIGMAPGAKWIACRNMDAGVGRPSTYLSCFQFFLAPTMLDGSSPDPSKRPDVIGNSYSCPLSEQCIDLRVMQTAVESLRAAGIFMSVSAGNSGSACSSINTPPALEPSVFTVGASGYNTNTLASFSSRGPVIISATGETWAKPDIVAPGVSVYSSTRGNGYASLQGTSMASPHVAGAVALLWSARPDLRGDVAGVEQLLKNSALHLPANYGGISVCSPDNPGDSPNNAYGYGQLDVLAALNLQGFRSYWPLVIQ